MNTNEQQWQECSLDEATHAQTASNEIYEMRETSSGVLFTDIGNGCRIYWYSFRSLGITPVKAFEVKPVEFVGKAWGVSFDGDCTEITIRVGGNVGGKHGKDLIGRTLKVEVQP